ncbi:uncharacterized protein DUF5114 [Marinilabilia salmonicolor]|jgi:hypothetical protein|uniref:DUF5114 domain-containing protein n=1 Tax=Marinilabilia salmonicolor TaxID=989 RepID=UPI000D070B90|nr:DUF5114 domain-containing protein [Marinilabilia salmonicolor]PRZ01295.1 uncharacterized protein DUF5114 [Marinilabilia salmonicolor]
MQNIKTYIGVFFLILLAVACEKEGDKIYLSGLEAADLSVSGSEVVLTIENSDLQVLSFSWESGELSVSNDTMGVASGLPGMTVEVSASSDFVQFTELQGTGNQLALTGARLNALAKDAGLQPDVASPLYFRVRSSVGNNMEPVYSNVISVDVTPFVIDMSKLYLLNAEQNDTLATIYSPEENGEYAGFVKATGWMNFYFQEGDGVIYGNNGVSEVPFELSTDAETMWNCWFPANGGHYYVTMSTADMEWTATWLPKISVGGAVEDSLAFFKSQELWAGVIETTAAGAQVTLSSDALLYNTDTGDTDDGALATTVSFAESGSGNIVLAETPGNFTVPSSGINTITLDLTGASGWTYTIDEGENLPQEEVVIPFLYLPGSKDGETGGSWTFDNFIPLLNNALYGGFVDINSQWGFQMFTAPEWGVDYYTMGESEGLLEMNVENRNIPAPDPGTYWVKADVENMTYGLTPLGDVLYLSGLNDQWDFNTTIPKTGEGIYSGTIEVSTPSTDGFSLYLEADNWDDKFGGSDGTLGYGWGNITDDTEVGTYTLTVDLYNLTYEMTLNQ